MSISPRRGGSVDIPRYLFFLQGGDLAKCFHTSRWSCLCLVIGPRDKGNPSLVGGILGCVVGGGYCRVLDAEYLSFMREIDWPLVELIYAELRLKALYENPEVMKVVLELNIEVILMRWIIQ